MIYLKIILTSLKTSPEDKG